jgi:hypothetical protein
MTTTSTNPGTPTTPIRELFQSDVTRDIPPVVYFHEQSPEKLATEVGEYIVTGGWPPDHPNHRRVPEGIHEQYVRLLRALCAELDKPGGPELPTAWISGFYGSGKSSFAKLLGLALDGVALPDGRSLAQAWLARDLSPRAAELGAAWHALRQKVDPIAVVFDVGSIARDNEHLHAAALRQVQQRLGYCAGHALVADFELRLERDGHYARFEETAARVLGAPWSQARAGAFAEDDFSRVLHELYPERYPDPDAWFARRAGTQTNLHSPEEAVAAIADMLRFRAPKATLFLVVDEVSQYVVNSRDRVDRLRAFATALGARLRGRAWLLALGQQKLDEGADDSFLIWAKDRFPPQLRVHLSASNIRDVVHRRLLHKKPDAEPALRALFETHRANLKRYAFGGEDATTEELVEVYPLLPGQIDLILQITSALRLRSQRAQGDDQAIRGLLQLLGELFRDRALADEPVGTLVTLDRVYDVQHTALDSDTQASMARILEQCADDADGTLVRTAKVVALLELVQDLHATDARLVAQCLYDRVDLGNNVTAVNAALETLRQRNLLSYSEKLGYKLQSSAGEEWERERRDVGAPPESRIALVQEALRYLLGTPDRPRLQQRPFPWAGLFSDGRRIVDASLLDPRDDAAVRVDLRWLAGDERSPSSWVPRSDDGPLRDRLLWIAEPDDPSDTLARELAKSRGLLAKYTPRRDSLPPARRQLLLQEQDREERLLRSLRDAVAGAFLAGRLYFRARPMAPVDLGATFAAVLEAAGTRILPDLYPHYVDVQVQPSELAQLLVPELSGPPVKFLGGAGLGILELDAGRYVPSCKGVVPDRVRGFIETQDGVSGASLIAHFGGPPYGYVPNVVKACAAGLLRLGLLRIQPDEGTEITSFRDPGAVDLFDKDRVFRRASFFLIDDAEGIPAAWRARIQKLFAQRLGLAIDRENDAIADTVANHFPNLARDLRDLQARLAKLPGAPTGPPALDTLHTALEACIRASRYTLKTVRLVKAHHDALNDGIALLQLLRAELTPDAVAAVRRASDSVTVHAAQLHAVGQRFGDVEPALARISQHLELDRPWREVASLAPDIDALEGAYRRERARLIARQETLAEHARGRVKARTGFALLTAEQAHRVLEPINKVGDTTTEDAVAPTLAALCDAFDQRLRQAEERANEVLDELLSKGPNPTVVTLSLGLKNREVATVAEVEALVGEVRDRLLAKVREGARVRLT